MLRGIFTIMNMRAVDQCSLISELACEAIVALRDYPTTITVPPHLKQGKGEYLQPSMPMLVP